MDSGMKGIDMARVGSTSKMVTGLQEKCFHTEIQGIGELRCVSGLSYKGEWSHRKKTWSKERCNFLMAMCTVVNLLMHVASGQGDMHYADPVCL
ncbi:hypothetical protein OS493_003367 [Desmophyllum pertusum]|uniref:Uncharacterized protein n=1 Tax=Desmophyllum pertusum TaxID=174260 RepID=A0A9X0A6K0_9CNID|nr:hypothetical protein OS493_003367 [Desmophyllum pertusum]